MFIGAKAASSLTSTLSFSASLPFGNSACGRTTVFMVSTFRDVQFEDDPVAIINGKGYFAAERRFPSKRPFSNCAPQRFVDARGIRTMVAARNASFGGYCDFAGVRR